MSRRRAKSYDKGWWMMRREGFHLTQLHPPSVFRPETLGSVLEEAVSELPVRKASLLEKLVDEWGGLVGEQVAAHARPGRLDAAILCVYVTHSIWLNELSRYGKRQMLTNIQKRFGVTAVRDIRLQLDPDGSF